MTDWTLEPGSRPRSARARSRRSRPPGTVSRGSSASTAASARSSRWTRGGARDRPPPRGRAGGAAGWRGPLHGVPLAYKDLCAIRGLPTSCGTRTGRVLPGRAGLHGGVAARGRGRGHARQAQHDRARDGTVRRQRPPRPRPESVAGRALHRRLLERLRGRGGGGASPWAPSAAIPAGPSGCPPRPAASSGSSRPTAG